MQASGFKRLPTAGLMVQVVVELLRRVVFPKTVGTLRPIEEKTKLGNASMSSAEVGMKSLFGGESPTAWHTSVMPVRRLHQMVS